MDFRGQQKTRFSYQESGFLDFLVFLTAEFWCACRNRIPYEKGLRDQKCPSVVPQAGSCSPVWFQTCFGPIDQTQFFVIQAFDRRGTQKFNKSSSCTHEM